MTTKETPGGNQPPRVRDRERTSTEMHPTPRTTECERWLAEAMSRAKPLTDEQRDAIRLAFRPDSIRAAS